MMTGLNRNVLTLKIVLINVTLVCNIELIDHGSVYPRILSESRARRSMNIGSSVDVSIGSWILRTRMNNPSIIPQNFQVNWITADSIAMPAAKSHVNCKIGNGHVVNSENSLVIITICDGDFYVIIEFDDGHFSVEPASNGIHVLREFKMLKNSIRTRRSSGESFYNLTCDTLLLDGDLGSADRGDESAENKESLDGGATERPVYFSDRTRTRAKLPSEQSRLNTASIPEPSRRWLELGIAVDYSVINFHGERVQQYVLALFNIVTAIYRDASLGANLSLVIIRIFFYVDRNDGMVRQGNAKRSLENVNKWNRRILTDSSINEGHDVAVWLTRLDIGGPSGYAPVSGACDPTRSCTLNRDEGLTSAFIIAHELAHVLGLTHDGDESSDNFCGDEATDGSIMAPIVAATFHRYRWSSCSKKEFRRQAKYWKCLNNQPKIHNSTLLKAILYNSFTMDEQCRMEFGEGYQLCRGKNLSDVCSHLWCGHKNSHQICKTKKGPPLEGTACGNAKWCINGYCETIDRTKFTLEPTVNNSRNVGWSTWSPWGRCSRTCGVAVRLRSRQCNEPVSVDGENICQGSSQDFKICEQTECTIMTDVRQEKCSQLPNLAGFNKTSDKYKMTWLPHEIYEEPPKCKLVCRSAERALEIHVSDDFLPDGTPCSYGSTNICIQGKCYEMGCDKILRSVKRFDACGICNGDNSTCIRNSNKFHRKIRRATTRIAILPRESHAITITVGIIPVPLDDEIVRIIFRGSKRSRHQIIDADGIIVEGTLFRIRRIDNQYKISGKGPTLADIVFSISVARTIVHRQSTLIISSTYITKRAKISETNKWILGGWSSCSVSCGEGFRRRTIACIDQLTDKIIHKRKCLFLPKPIQDIETCTLSKCDFKWIVGPWEGCTQTCGTLGIQRRQIYCIHSSFVDDELTPENEQEVYTLILSPNICNKHHPPENQRECNRFPCQGRWAFTEWSSCSQSCGRGLQSRMARCVSPTGESSFDCVGSGTPDQMRPCWGQGRGNSGCESFCRSDKSKYCILPSLKKYCIVSDFRRQCCRSCQK